MKNEIVKLFMFPILLGSIACGEVLDTVEAAADMVEPVLGRADSLSSVSKKGSLVFDEAMPNIFDEDVAFHGYEFTSLSGGLVDVEVMRKGSSSKLDTTLFVYGREGANNWERLAFDNDSGWGKLSKLRGIEMDARYSKYMVVVGTRLGKGRGKYSLKIDCANDACIYTAAVDFNGCDADIYAGYEACVDNELDNADWGPDDSDAPELQSIEYCVGDHGVLESRTWDCDPGDANASSFCRASNDEILAVATQCETKLKENYNVFDRPTPLSTLSMAMPAALEEYSFELQDDDFSEFDLSAYSVPVNATSEEIATSFRDEYPISRALSVSDSISRRQYTAGTDVLEGLKTLLESEYGSSYYEVIDISGHAVDVGGEAWITMTVFHFTRKNIVFVLTEISGG